MQPKCNMAVPMFGKHLHCSGYFVLIYLECAESHHWESGVMIIRVINTTDWPVGITNDLSL